MLIHFNEKSGREKYFGKKCYIITYLFNLMKIRSGKIFWQKKLFFGTKNVI